MRKGDHKKSVRFGWPVPCGAGTRCGGQGECIDREFSDGPDQGIINSGQIDIDQIGPHGIAE
jgi:hypothetical protein